MQIDFYFIRHLDGLKTRPIGGTKMSLKILHIALTLVLIMPILGVVSCQSSGGTRSSFEAGMEEGFWLGLGQVPFVPDETIRTFTTVGKRVINGEPFPVWYDPYWDRLGNQLLWGGLADITKQAVDAVSPGVGGASKTVYNVVDKANTVVDVANDYVDEFGYPRSSSGSSSGSSTGAKPVVQDVVALGMIGETQKPKTTYISTGSSNLYSNNDNNGGSTGTTGTGTTGYTGTNIFGQPVPTGNTGYTGTGYPDYTGYNDPDDYTRDTGYLVPTNTGFGSFDDPVFGDTGQVIPIGDTQTKRFSTTDHPTGSAMLSLDIRNENGNLVPAGTVVTVKDGAGQEVPADWSSIGTTLVSGAPGYWVIEINAPGYKTNTQYVPVSVSPSPTDFRMILIKDGINLQPPTSPFPVSSPQINTPQPTDPPIQPPEDIQPGGLSQTEKDDILIDRLESLQGKGLSGDEVMNELDELQSQLDQQSS